LLLIEFTPVAQAQAATESSPTAIALTGGTTSGATEAKIASNKIGALLLAEGLAAMTATEIEVSGKKDKSSPRETQLSGTVVRLEKFGTGHGERQTGWAYFNAGPGLAGLSEKCPERVDLNSGEKYTGHILKLTADGLDFQDAGGAHHFEMGVVKLIHSPRVFAFTIYSPSGESKLKINFNATCTKIGAETPTKTSTKVIALVVAVALIATAIAVPVAIGVATHHHSSAQPLFFFPKSNVSAAAVSPPVKPIIIRRRPPGNNGG